MTTIPLRVKALVKKHGSLRAAARAIRLSAPYLMRLRDGDKKDPSDKVLRKLRLRRVVTFVGRADGGRAS